MLFLMFRMFFSQAWVRLMITFVDFHKRPVYPQLRIYERSSSPLLNFRFLTLVLLFAGFLFVDIVNFHILLSSLDILC